jgi:ABC-type transport system involved in multi-copper enzyme maturation permease subunit
MRLGMSPVFIYECLANSRRWQTYAIRSIGVSILLVAVATIAMSRSTANPANLWRDYAALGQSYFYAIIGVELTLVLLAAPAATAGAICVDRARGTLTHMLVTELTDAEIVLGKLAARLLPVLGLVACTWPVLSICSLLGGIDPTALTLAFAIILSVALVGCSMALALSVWARKSHEVVLVTYTFWGFVLLLWPIWTALSMTGWVGTPPLRSLSANPYYLAFAPYTVPGRMVFWDYFGFFAGTLGVSVLLIFLAVWRMRPVACRGNVDDRKESKLGLVARLTRWLPGPSLDRNPVLWREWHRSRPSRWLMILIVILGGTTGTACVVGAVSTWANGLDSFHSAARGIPWPIIGVYGYFLQLIFGFLMLSAVAPMSMSEERQRGSLDLLATTTLSTPEIVIGKWLGTLRWVLFLAIGPGLVGLALATAYRTPSVTPSVAGLPPDIDVELSRIELLFAATLLVATILIHGMLLSAIGVAVATWIKLQSRAIAASVGLAVMLNAGWPMFIGVTRMGMAGQGMMCLSPIGGGALFVDRLSMRRPQLRQLLSWTSFWDIECIVLSMGLLWLTIRTFDGCFGRIPDRPRRASVLSDVVVLLAVLLGVGSLFGSIAIWINGSSQGLDVGIVACALLATVGLVLLSMEAPASISRTETPQSPALESSAAILDRGVFLGRWWESFRLVMLLAIGPALIGLALATVHRPPGVEPKITTLPGGGSERIWTDPWGQTRVMTTDASGVRNIRDATDAEIAARPVRPSQTASLLTTAFLAVLTILAHGAMVVSLGQALGTWLRRRGRAIVASASLYLFVTVGWPILYLYCGYPTYPRAYWTLASPIPAIVVLLVDHADEDVIEQIVWWATYWDLLFILMAVVVSALAIWTLKRRSRAYASLEEDAEDGQLEIETVCVGD